MAFNIPEKNMLASYAGVYTETDKHTTILFMKRFKKLYRPHQWHQFWPQVFLSAATVHLCRNQKHL